MLFIGVQWKMAPFECAVANRFEFELLCALPIVIMCAMPALEDLVFVALVRAVMVLLPVPLMLWWYALLIGRGWRQHNEENAKVMQFHIEDQMQYDHDAAMLRFGDDDGDGLQIQSHSPGTSNEMAVYKAPTASTTGMSNEGDGATKGDGAGTERRHQCLDVMAAVDESNETMDIELEMTDLHEMIGDIVDHIYEGGDDGDDGHDDDGYIISKEMRE